MTADPSVRPVPLRNALPWLLCAALFACGGAEPVTLGPAPATFDGLVAQVNGLPANLKQAAVVQFWTGVTALPLIEGKTAVTYLWRGAAGSINVPGDANDWDQNAAPMQRLAGTDLWFAQATFESDARLDYKLYLDGAWTLDPNNPHKVAGGLGNNSELRMPDYADPPELAITPGIAHGEVLYTSVTSTFLGNTRTVGIYLPPSYASSTASYPLVLFHDGLEFITLAQAPNTLDNLIHAAKIREVIGVFVPPVDRADEYIGVKQDLFVSFISQEVLPQVRAGYRVAPGAANAATVGISNGGDVSQYLGVRLPGTFGNVGCFSAFGSFPQSLNGYLAAPPTGQVFYMDAGTYDLPGFLDGTKGFVNQVLSPKGYTYRFNTWHQGHSWGNWRAHLGLALELFFPPGP